MEANHMYTTLNLKLITGSNRCEHKVKQALKLWIFKFLLHRMHAADCSRGQAMPSDLAINYNAVVWYSI